VGHQEVQESELLGAETDLVVVTPRAPGGNVDANGSRGDRSFVLGLRHRSRAPQVGSDSRQQLGQAKRLDEVVVCAGVEARDHVELLVSR